MQKLAIITTMAMLAAGSASAATVLNGSFEDPGFASAVDPWVMIPAGGAGIDDWTVALGGVDLVRGDFWDAADGNYSVDINSTEEGGIYTTITDMVVGYGYTITFALSGNPIGNRFPGAGADPVKNLQAYVGESLAVFDSWDFEFDTTGRDLDDMGWVDVSFSFEATSEEMFLGFTSLGSSAWGAAVDDVRISAVPLPMSALLLLSGLGGLAAYRRKKS